MIHCWSSASETTLEVGKMVVGFYEPNDPPVDHAFHSFAQAACYGKRTIVRMGWDFFFPGLGIGMMIAIYHDSGNVPFRQISLKALRR